MKMVSGFLAAVAWLCLSCHSPAQDAATNSATAASPAASDLKFELVAETKKGSGEYEVLDAAPLFPADSGVGHGEPRFMTMSNPKVVLLILQSNLDPAKIGTIEADIGGPKAHFKGKLVETAANSGVFADEKKTVTVTLPAGISTTANKNLGFVQVGLTSDALGFHDAQFALYYWPSRLAGGGCFISEFGAVEIQFPVPYDPQKVNHLHATMSFEISDPETGSSTGGISPFHPGIMNRSNEPVELTETAAGSLTFVDPASEEVIHLTHFTGTDPSRVDRMDAVYPSPMFGPSHATLTLTETSPNSMGFTTAATIGEKPEDNEGTDEAPDDPEVTGDGVFRIRIHGAKGPVKLIVKSDVNLVSVTAEPMAKDPTTMLTGPLILVLKNSSGNTHYKTIQTLYSTGQTGIQIAQAGSATDKPQSADDFANQGTFEYGQGHFNAAITWFDMALAINPKFAGAYVNRGAAKAGKKDFDGAIADFNQALKLTPEDAETYYNRGVVKAFEKNYSGASADYSQAIRLNPKHAGAYSGRGETNLILGDVDAALADFNQTLLLDPQSDHTLFTRGVSKMATGDLPGAVADWREFIELEPTDSNADYAHLFIWLNLMEQGQKGDAIEQLSSALQHHWNAPQDAWVSKDAAFLLDQIKESSYLAAAASPDSDKDRSRHCEAWYYAGMKRLLAKERASALADFQKSVATKQADFMEYTLAISELKAAMGASK
jgi:lipoprotein NlpI